MFLPNSLDGSSILLISFSHSQGVIFITGEFMKRKYLVIIAIFAICLAGFCFFPRVTNWQGKDARDVSYSKKNKNNKSQKEKLPYQDPQDLAKPGTWQKKSEKKPHPNLAGVKNLWIRVSLKGNRTYIMSGKKPIYTMLSSGGLYNKKGQSDTPTGTFHIQEERGLYFFNSDLNEGARNYVSWRDHGVYLFHSVPTKADKSINKTEAAKLGKSTGSHGCVRLSIPDSEWLCKTVPVNTKVVIKDE